MKTQYIKKIKEIQNDSGGKKNCKIHGQVMALKKGHYRLLDIPMDGDAPKDFIQVYTYGECLKSNPKTWPKYIAKVGHKWYPIESITEYLINRIGIILGLNMAESELRLIDNQIRFLSKYFLKPNEKLEHGAEIFSAFLEEQDQSFVNNIEKEGRFREWFTFQSTLEAITFVFPKESHEIKEAFVRLITFDAIIGNKDRHFYNWGVIKDIEGKRAARFSPIYDSARGLFWNVSEKKLASKYLQKSGINSVPFDKYIQKSLPKTGWSGSEDLNHFEIIYKVVEQYPGYHKVCKSMLQDVHLENMLIELHTNFRSFFSFNRILLIEACLTERFKILQNLCF